MDRGDAAEPTVTDQQHPSAHAHRECGEGKHDDGDEQRGFAVHEGVQGTETPPRSALTPGSADVAHDAELVAFGVGQDDERILGIVAGPAARGADRFDRAGGRRFILRGEVDMQTVLAGLGFRDALEGDPRSVVG